MHFWKTVVPQELLVHLIRHALGPVTQLQYVHLLECIRFGEHTMRGSQGAGYLFQLPQLLRIAHYILRHGKRSIANLIDFVDTTGRHPQLMYLECIHVSTRSAGHVCCVDVIWRYSSFFGECDMARADGTYGFDRLAEIFLTEDNLTTKVQSPVWSANLR